MITGQKSQYELFTVGATDDTSSPAFLGGSIESGDPPPDPWEMNNLYPLPAKYMESTTLWTKWMYNAFNLATCKGETCNKLAKTPAGWTSDKAVLPCHSPGPRKPVVEALLDPDFPGQYEGVHRLDALLGMGREV